MPSVSHQLAVAGQHHVGQLGRPGEEHVLHDEVVEATEQPPGPVDVGLRLGRVLAHHVRARSSPWSIASNMAVRCLP